MWVVYLSITTAIIIIFISLFNSIFFTIQPTENKLSKERKKRLLVNRLTNNLQLKIHNEVWLIAEGKNAMNNAG